MDLKVTRETEKHARKWLRKRLLPKPKFKAHYEILEILTNKPVMMDSMEAERERMPSPGTSKVRETVMSIEETLESRRRFAEMEAQAAVKREAECQAASAAITRRNSGIEIQNPGPLGAEEFEAGPELENPEVEKPEKEDGQGCEKSEKGDGQDSEKSEKSEKGDGQDSDTTETEAGTAGSPASGGISTGMELQSGSPSSSTTSGSQNQPESSPASPDLTAALHQRMSRLEQANARLRHERNVYHDRSVELSQKMGDIERESNWKAQEFENEYRSELSRIKTGGVLTMVFFIASLVVGGAGMSIWGRGTNGKGVVQGRKKAVPVTRQSTQTAATNPIQNNASTAENATDFVGLQNATSAAECDEMAPEPSAAAQAVSLRVNASDSNSSPVGQVVTMAPKTDPVDVSWATWSHFFILDLGRFYFYCVGWALGLTGPRNNHGYHFSDRSNVRRKIRTLAVETDVSILTGQISKIREGGFSFWDLLTDQQKKGRKIRVRHGYAVPGPSESPLVDYTLLLLAAFLGTKLLSKLPRAVYRLATRKESRSRSSSRGHTLRRKADMPLLINDGA